MDLITKIKELSAACKGYADISLINDIDALEEKIEMRKLYVVITGLFKRGKSTLINSLIEKQILPVSVTPATALITVIEYNEKPGAIVHLLNGKKKDIEIDIIDEYVTEEKNPGNKKGVRYVQIYENSEILKYISLVDSPGLGSAYEHNTQATLDFIPKIDAAVFILSADIPINTIDLKLLEEIQKHVTKIIFVFNKADLLKEEDLQKLILHNKTVLSGILKKDKNEIEFYIVSNVSSEHNDLGGLKKELLSVGSNEKEALLELSSAHQLKTLCRQAELQLHFIADAYLLPLHELEKRSLELSGSIQLMNEQKEEFESIITGKIKLLQKDINDDVNKQSNALQSKVNYIISAIQGIKSELLISSHMRLDDLMRQSFENIKNEWEIKAREHFKNLLQQYSKRSQSFLNELSANLSIYLGQNIDLFSAQFDLNAYTSFYITFDSGLSAVNQPLSFFDNLFPFSFQKRKVISKWKSHYNELITRNTASIIYDLNYKIQESFRKFNYDLNSKMNVVLGSMENNIREVISSKTKTELQNEGAIKEINTRLIRVKEIFS